MPDRRPGVGAHGPGHLLDHLVHGLVGADGALVHVDHENRGPLAELCVWLGPRGFAVGQHLFVILGQEIVPNRHITTSCFGISLDLDGRSHGASIAHSPWPGFGAEFSSKAAVLLAVKRARWLLDDWDILRLVGGIILQ